MEPNGKLFSLGIYEQREADYSYKYKYEVAAESFRIKAEREYGRPVILRENKYA